MALFNKLFSTHKRKPVNASATSTKNAKQFPFTNEQVRILLYRECDWRGRRLLFDSTAVHKIPPTTTTTMRRPSAAQLHSNNPPISLPTPSSDPSKKAHPSYIDTVNGIAYRYAKPAEDDFNDIGEMIFGAVAMSVRATALKVHWLPEPMRLLCSQVFVTPVPTGNRNSRGVRDPIASLTTLTTGNCATTLPADNGSGPSMDTSSLNSFSLSVSVCISDGLNRLEAAGGQSAGHTHPLDVPQNAGQSVADVQMNGSGVAVGGTAAFSERNLAYSDSGYGGTDPWTTSSSSSYYPFHTSASTRSSFGSVFSDHGDSSAAGGGRKFSTDSSIAGTSEQQQSLTAAATAASAATSSTDGGVIQRRIQRHMTTSFENRKSLSDCVGYIGDQQQHQQQTQQHSSVQMHREAASNMTATNVSHLSVGARSTTTNGGGSEGCVSGRLPVNRQNSEQQQAETHSNPEFVRNRRNGVNSGCGAATLRSGKRAKLGLAVCIQLSDNVELEMQTFCAEHIVLLESMLCRLRAAAETAYANQKRFYQVMLHAWFAAAEWLVDLFTAPRLVEPVWLALSGGYAQDAKQLAQGFMHELCWLLNCADTKDSNFFISTLLTAILTHHLGWVGTVAPLPAANGNAYDLASSSNPNMLHMGQQLAHEERAKMSAMARFHPYNVLWAQMSDLYGAIGSPPKVSKTIVCGTEEQLIGKVLNVLTYFIRCGQIEREIRSEVFEKQVIDDILDDFVSCTTKLAKPEPPTDAETPRCCSSSSNGGLTRTSTCRTALCDEDSSHVGRKNDIPNVLIFRDSRFVKQELRIGNFLMDTGIEMTGMQRQQIRDYRIKQPDVKVLVTSPTLEEFSTVGDAVSNGSDDTVEEATENASQYDGTATVSTSAAAAASSSETSSAVFEETCTALKTSPSLSDLITANSLGGAGNAQHNNNNIGGVAAELVSAGTSAFLWGIEPIKEGVIEEQWQHLRKGTEMRRTLKMSGGSAAPSSSPVPLSDEQASTVTGTTVIETLKRSKSLFSKSSNAKNVDRIRRSKSRKNIAQQDEDDRNQLETMMAMTVFDAEDDDSVPISAPPLKSYPSLSDLITANSCGASERLTWGIEPVKESVTLDEVHHFENSHKRIESNATLRRNNSGPIASTASPLSSVSTFNTASLGVVFVLGGDNETLANLKSSASPKKTLSSIGYAAASGKSLTPPPPKQITAIGSDGKKTCSHKKHSGVKFNFEKYPQIATNYMKNKNIDLAHYDKACMKLDGDSGAGASTSMMASSTVAAAVAAAADSGSDSESSECECCAGNATRTQLLQTPSNATEMEFSNEDNNYPTSTATTAFAITTKPIISTSKQQQQHPAIEDHTPTPTRVSYSSASASETFGARSSMSTTADQTSNNSIRLITLPMSKYQLKTSTATMRPAAKNAKSTGKADHPEQQQQTAIRPAGFIPSLFVGITDHYVADMVLQGTTAPLAAWENRLKHNLSLSAHCATLESRITENVAILANTDKWDVKVVSSQTYVLPCGSGTSGPIGMSQLVATMLETVNAMWSTGLSAYQCMAYIESKLQELYLQSETLAAFLLATEFCSLNTVTAALNLSANDVPLLLSVASVHSPQVTKKYGVSFR